MKPIHAGLVGLALLAGCNNDNVMAATERAYNQIQRLGNPLVSEVFGSLLDASDPGRGVTADNVAASDVAFDSAFPYHAPPHLPWPALHTPFPPSKGGLGEAPC